MDSSEQEVRAHSPSRVAFPVRAQQANARQVDHRSHNGGNVGVVYQPHSPQGGVPQQIIGESEHCHRNQHPQRGRYLAALRAEPQFQQGFGQKEH